MRRCKRNYFPVIVRNDISGLTFRVIKLRACPFVIRRYQIFASEGKNVVSNTPNLKRLPMSTVPLPRRKKSGYRIMSCEHLGNTWRYVIVIAKFWSEEYKGDIGGLTQLAERTTYFIASV